MLIFAHILTWTANRASMYTSVYIDVDKRIWLGIQKSFVHIKLLSSLHVKKNQVYDLKKKVSCIPFHLASPEKVFSKQIRNSL